MVKLATHLPEMPQPCRIKYHNKKPDLSKLAKLESVLILLDNINTNAPILDDGVLKLKQQALKENDPPIVFTERFVNQRMQYIAWVSWSPTTPLFKRQEILSQALRKLSTASNQPPAIYSCASAVAAASEAIYVTLTHFWPLPNYKKTKTLTKQAVHVFGNFDQAQCAEHAIFAHANSMCRSLTCLPGNKLTPDIYVNWLKTQAKDHDLSFTFFDQTALKKMGAGAFLAVSQCLPRNAIDNQAGIVRLTYRPKNAKKRVVLVGKGVCFDTGGINLKPANYMRGMHEDMAGSAIVYAVIQAAKQLGLDIHLEAWLAITRNEIGVDAYRPGDVVTAYDGTTIEIVHSDAEGRMILADTLAIASEKPCDLLIDFATLTGSMKAALGNRYSGAFTPEPSWQKSALDAAQASGERLCFFPLDDDYKKYLESQIADLKQCASDGMADHIQAALFLQHFVNKDTPWIHMDVSAEKCPNGLGAISSDITGFGVAWTLALLQDYIKKSSI